MPRECNLSRAIWLQEQPPHLALLIFMEILIPEKSLVLRGIPRFQQFRGMLILFRSLRGEPICIRGFPKRFRQREYPSDMGFEIIKVARSDLVPRRFGYSNYLIWFGRRISANLRKSNSVDIFFLFRQRANVWINISWELDLSTVFNDARYWKSGNMRIRFWIFYMPLVVCEIFHCSLKESFIT